MSALPPPQSDEEPQILRGCLWMIVGFLVVIGLLKVAYLILSY